MWNELYGKEQAVWRAVVRSKDHSDYMNVEKGSVLYDCLVRYHFECMNGCYHLQKGSLLYVSLVRYHFEYTNGC